MHTNAWAAVRQCILDLCTDSSHEYRLIDFRSELNCGFKYNNNISISVQNCFARVVFLAYTMNKSLPLKTQQIVKKIV